MRNEEKKAKADWRHSIFLHHYGRNSSREQDLDSERRDLERYAMQPQRCCNSDTQFQMIYDAEKVVPCKIIAKGTVLWKETPL